MTIYQLFRDKPPISIVIELLEKVGIENLQDTTNTFTQEDVNNYLDSDCLKKNIILLKEYYLPCKYKNYCEEVTPKKVITIMRQCLRPYGYKLESKEKYSSGRKHIIYFLKNYNSIIKKPENECLVSFD